ncbi:LysM peptidoglycan-binding domain-containing protein [Methylocystis rosea]|uniref:LysM peptidoglycan-binding domain-containing protein n=2 Tax=Methylocystis rosea TaxID=173366 RepID=A0A3G8M4E8_9HYPH|nr:LysM peptidoglycan-binding domain-containing protein [Methylocystis rosea]
MCIEVRPTARSWRHKEPGCMSSNLTSHVAAIILVAALVAALTFHLTRILTPQRLLHLAYAAAALGLIYLLGDAAFGWSFAGAGVLLWAYLALFLLAAAQAVRRRMTLGAIGLPWLSALIQLGVVAYMFAPLSFQKPPVTAALFLYFAFEALVWLRGSEPEEQHTRAADGRERPALVPPKRRRGLAEASLVAAALAIAYLLFVGPPGPNVGPDSSTAQLQEPQPEQTGESAEPTEPAAAVAQTEPAASDAAPKAESEASQSTEPAAQVAANETAVPPAPAVDSGTYTARAGDTFKSIARRLYGATSKWRAIAERNPDLKSKKLRAGQLVNLPSAPTR